MKKTIKNAAFFLMMFCLILFLILNTREVSEYISEAVERCIYIIIPSLFAMLAVSGMIIKSGILGRGNMPAIFLISMFAGYPTGAKILSDEFDLKNITKKQAEFYMSVCFGAGPAFIFGCVSDILFSGNIAGIIILISNISANLLILILITFFFRNQRKNKKDSYLHFNSQMFVDSVVSGGKSIFSICVMIIFFSVFICMLKSSGIITFLSESLSALTGISQDICGKIFESLLEVTNLSRLSKNNYTLLPFICSAISFGGICVILQIRAVINSSLSIMPFIYIRIICALISGIICFLIMPFMLKNQAVIVSEINVRTYSAESPVPSYMLVIMIIILLFNFRNFRSFKD